jgi:hypothetical protein
VSIYDRWHKTHLDPGDKPCGEHSRGKTRLYPNAEHLQGYRWQVRWRDEGGRQCKRNFPILMMPFAGSVNNRKPHEYLRPLA